MPYHKKELQPKLALPGVTLFEVCLVLSLLSFLFCLVLSSVQVSRRYHVRVELDRIYSCLRYLQRKALIDQKEYRLSFDRDHASCTADVVWTLADSVEFGVRSKVLGPPGNPHKEITDFTTWRSGTVEVYPNGTLSAGTLYLTDTLGTCLFALSCDASEITGLRRYYYDGVWRMIE